MAPTRKRKASARRENASGGWPEAARVRRGVLLFLVVAVPIFFARFLNDPINVPKLSLLVVGLSGVICVRLLEVARGSPVDRLKDLAVPAVAIAAPLIVAWLFTPYKEWSAWGNYPRFLGLLPYLLTILLGVLLVDAFSGRAEPLAWALVGSGAVVGAYAVVQVMGLDPFAWSLKGNDAGHVATSTLGNQNFVGGFLGIVLPVLVGLALVQRDRSRWILLLAVPTVAGWLAAQSEGGWAAGLAGLAVVGGFALAPRWSRARIAGLLLASLILLGVVGSVLWSVAVPGTPISSTITRRSEWWRGAMAMAVESPFVGSGPSLFALEGTRFRTEADAAAVGFDFTDDPHSVFLSFLTSAGLLGLAGLSIGIGWFLLKGVGLDGQNLLGAAFFGGVVAYLVQASISIDPVSLRSAFWTVAAGLVASRAPLESRGPARKKRSKSRAGAQPPWAISATVAAILIALGGTWWGSNLMMADARFQHASNLLAAGQGDEALDAFDRALSFRDEPSYRRAFGRQVGSIAVALADQGEEERAREFFELARKAFAYSLRLPHANSVVDYARFMRDWSVSHPEARPTMVTLYERALVLDPRNPALQEEAETAMSEEISSR